MSSLLWYVLMIAASVLALMACAVLAYMAGRMFSAGWHTSKLKLLREFHSTIKQGE